MRRACAGTPSISLMHDPHDDGPRDLSHFRPVPLPTIPTFIARSAFHRLIHEEGLRDSMFILVSNIKDPGSDTLMKEVEIRHQMGITELDPTTHPVKVIEVNAFQPGNLAPIMTHVCKTIAKMNAA